MNPVPSSSSKSNPAKDLTQAITDLAGAIGVKDRDRIQLTAKTIFAAAREEAIPLQHVAQAVKDFALGKVDDFNPSFFPTPGNVMQHAREVWKEARQALPSQHDREPQYPPGIQERINKIQKLLKSDDYRLAKYHHLMRLHMEGRINYDPTKN